MEFVREFSVCDKNRYELELLQGYESLDFDIGVQNDFELKIPKENAKKCGLELGGWVLSHNTEYCGLLESLETTTDSDMMTWQGSTIRGLLDKDIVVPLSGANYRIAKGEANAQLRVILAENGACGTLFTVPNYQSGATVDYQFHRYTSKLKGFTNMLLDGSAAGGLNYRMRIYAALAEDYNPFIISIEAVPIVDYSQEIEYSEDHKIAVKLTRAAGINHLICLGQGDLAARMVKHLYINRKGDIVSVKPSASDGYFGPAERIEVYDNSGAESEDDLIKGGTERLKEIMPSDTVDLFTTEGFEIEIGDIIGGRDYDTGLAVSKPVTGKILKAADGKEEIEVSVEGVTEDEGGEVKETTI
jgi:hypothetical protein